MRLEPHRAARQRGVADGLAPGLRRLDARDAHEAKGDIGAQRAVQHRERGSLPLAQEVAGLLHEARNVASSSAGTSNALMSLTM